MSDIPVNPIDPIPGGSGEGVAERYVDKELVESKASLRRTQIISVVLSIFVIGYMSYLTNGFRENMEPHAAATIVTGMASQRLDDVEPQVSDYIHQQIPEMIRKVPDQVIEQMPEYRKNIETRFETTLKTQVQQGSDQLNKQLDEFLTAHKDEVGQLLKNGQDPAAMAKFGDELEASFKQFLDGTKVGDETIQQKLDAALNALKQVSDRTTKLASNKGLTASEKSARHAVAMLMRQVDSAAPEGGAAMVKEHVSGLVNDAASTLKENMPSTGGMSMGGASMTEETPATGATPRMTPPPTKVPTMGKPGMPGAAPMSSGAPKPSAAKPAPAKA